MSKRNKQEPEGQKAETVIYVGPRLTYLRTGMIFRRSKMPSFLADLLKSCPTVDDLLVPASDFVRARAEVETQSSRLYASARKVAEALGN